MEQGDQAARRTEREKQESQQARLAGSGRAGQKLKGMRLDGKSEVLQDLRPGAVAQPDILESDQRGLQRIVCQPHLAIYGGGRQPSRWKVNGPGGGHWRPRTRIEVRFPNQIGRAS